MCNWLAENWFTDRVLRIQCYPTSKSQKPENQDILEALFYSSFQSEVSTNNEVFKWARNELKAQECEHFAKIIKTTTLEEWKGNCVNANALNCDKMMRETHEMHRKLGTKEQRDITAEGNS